MYTRYLPLMDSVWHAHAALPCSPALLFVRGPPRRQVACKSTILHVKAHQKRLQLRHHQHNPAGTLSWIRPQRRVHTSAPVRARALANDGYKVQLVAMCCRARCLCLLFCRNGHRCTLLRVHVVHTIPHTQDEYCEPERNVEYWNTRPIVVTQRALEVGLRFGRWLLETRLAARGAPSTDLDAVRAAKLRDVLIDLGPAFVKVCLSFPTSGDVVFCLPCTWGKRWPVWLAKLRTHTRTTRCL